MNEEQINAEAIEKYGKEAIVNMRQNVAKGLSVSELNLFLYNCMQTDLDPRRREIYAIKRGGSMSIQVAIDGFRLIAERTGKYSPGKDTEFSYDKNGSLLGAKVYVKKLTPDGTWHDISAVAFLKEYRANNNMWGKLTHVMLEKCAESRALRRAFPQDFSGLYTEEEMEQADEKEAENEEAISDEDWNTLDKYINGNKDLRDKLKILCSVSELRNINNDQLKACGDFARGYNTQKKNRTQLFAKP